MKTTARILSILLALVMVVGVCTTAMAADYAVVVNGQFAGIPADATDKVLISADGSDEDTTPDLIKGWYIYKADMPEGDTPAWDTFYGSQVYVKSLSNWWGVNRGEKCETQSGGGKDDKGSYRDKDGFKFYSHLIHVGLTIDGHSIPLDHGIGVMPSPKDQAQNYVLVNVDGYNHFYAITGITGGAANQNASNRLPEYGGSATSGTCDNRSGANTVIYEIWGSTKADAAADDSSFVKIASGEIGANNAGEFDVNVAAYKTLKLVTQVNDTKTQSNGGTECVWGEASLYNLPTDSSTPVTPPAPTGDVFSALPVALLVLSGAAIAVVLKKKEN